MTQEEHLNKIVAKCRELLAGAEKRSPGKWKASLNWVTSGPNDIAKTFHSAKESDAAFISSCAGPAEAGWRSTIAAIEGLRAVLKNNSKDPHLDGICTYGCDSPQIAESSLAQIIAAWPEELP